MTATTCFIPTFLKAYHALERYNGQECKVSDVTKMLTENCKSKCFSPPLSYNLSDLSRINFGETTYDTDHPPSKTFMNQAFYVTVIVP